MQLRRTLDLCHQADPIDAAALAATNSSSHIATWHASHNGSIIDLLDRLNLHLLRYPQTTLVYPGRWEEAQQEHEAILKAILDHDTDTASTVAERHFTRARDIRLELWGALGR